MRSRSAAMIFTPALLALAVAQAFAAPAPDALPTNGQVVAGSASIAQSGARMDINQSSQRVILEWQSFNIGSAAEVRFNQPNASAIALNRVLANDASQIMGKRSANGQVFLINPSGIVFGACSRVDVGGLVASSHPNPATRALSSPGSAALPWARAAKSPSPRMEKPATG